LEISIFRCQNVYFLGIALVVAVNCLVAVDGRSISQKQIV